MRRQHQKKGEKTYDHSNACRRTQRQFDCAPESEGPSKAAEDWQHNLIMHQHPLGLSACPSRYHLLTLMHLLVLFLVLNITFCDQIRTGTACCGHQPLALNLLADVMLTMQCKHTQHALRQAKFSDGACKTSCNKELCDEDTQPKNQWKSTSGCVW